MFYLVFIYYILDVPGHALLWLNLVKWKRNKTLYFHCKHIITNHKLFKD